MSDDDLLFTPAAELARLIREQKLSPVELTRAVLARAHASQDTLNAFITIADEQAMQDVATAIERIRAAWG